MENPLAIKSAIRKAVGIQYSGSFFGLLSFCFMYIRKSISLILIVILVSCISESGRKNINLSDIEVPEVQIKRYGKALFSLDTTNLKAALINIQEDYPVFLDGDLEDPHNLNRIRGFVSDTILINLNKDCQQKFPDLSNIEANLESVFRHYKYYFPEAIIPDVYTYVSGFDYEHKVQVYNNNLLIALDLYLGKDYPAYNQLGLSQYVFSKFDKKYLIRDCLVEISKTFINPRNVKNTLLDQIINEGKMLWFAKAMNPEMDNQILIPYSNEQLQWAKENEAMVWAFLIENELLYSTEPMAKQKFIKDGPFTSFFGNESPPRLGSWIGYLIIDKFMSNNPKVSLATLMNMYDSQQILKKSGYKPKL